MRGVSSLEEVSSGSLCMLSSILCCVFTVCCTDVGLSGSKERMLDFFRFSWHSSFQQHSHWRQDILISALHLSLSLNYCVRMSISTPSNSSPLMSTTCNLCLSLHRLSRHTLVLRYLSSVRSARSIDFVSDPQGCHSPWLSTFGSSSVLSSEECLSDTMISHFPQSKTF